MLGDRDIHAYAFLLSEKSSMSSMPVLSPGSWLCFTAVSSGFISCSPSGDVIKCIWRKEAVGENFCQCEAKGKQADLDAANNSIQNNIILLPPSIFLPAPSAPNLIGKCASFCGGTYQPVVLTSGLNLFKEYIYFEYLDSIWGDYQSLIGGTS